ncbi:hypothetical protein HY971_04110 [Candidatus Kaiserbacteria bacterium]|nr:hypothetical protein [Candidatus Kaiserbacteria bacterium]
MKKNTSFILITCAVLILIGLGYIFLRGGVRFPRIFNTGIVPASVLKADEPYRGAPLTKNYKNDTYRFSLSMSEDFSAQELPLDESGAHTILLQNAKGEGIQILVTPNQGTEKTLTTNDVRASIPDMKVTDEQAVEIGSDYTGVAFLSNNDAFGGASREVWFYFRGNLYQISTYARLDPLLKAMFGTWKFF